MASTLGQLLDNTGKLARPAEHRISQSKEKVQQNPYKMQHEGLARIELARARCGISWLILAS